MKKRLDYKWVIVGLCFLMVFTCLGFCSSTRGLFVKPITEAHSMERSVYAFTDSFRFIAVAVVNMFFGILVSKFGLRKLIAAGFVSLTLSMVIYATANVFWQFYIAGIFLGVGFSWTTTTMVGCVVNRWCKEHKGTIMGAILAANGLGGALATMLVTKIIDKEGNPLAYRHGYWMIAAVIACVGIIVVLFFREEPKNKSETPKAVEKATKKRRGNSWVGVEYARAVKMPHFYMAAVCIMLTGAILQGITGASAAHIEDVGITKSYVGLVMSVHSICLAIFKFATGVIYDKFGLRTTVNICSITAVGVMLILAFVTNTPAGRIMAMIYGVFSALALPLETIMLPIYAGDLFGEKSFDKVLGVFVSVNSVGYALGSVIINGCFDIFGSYKGVFIAAACVMFALIVVLQYVISKSNRLRVVVEKGKLSVADRLKELKEQLKTKAISKEEYNAQRAEIIKEL